MNIVTAIRDKIVNALLPVGYTPPRSAESNARTKKTKAQRAMRKERLRKLERRAMARRAA